MLLLLIILVAVNLGMEFQWTWPPSSTNTMIDNAIHHYYMPCDSQSLTTFAQAIQDIHWDEYEKLQKKDTAHLNEQILRPLYKIAFEFAIMEPKTHINASCQPPPLTVPPTEEECQSYNSSAFNGQVRSKPVKVGHAIMLGFDMDTLEIHLREICDVVDKVFIIEATMSHNGFLSPKPLAWEAVKQQSRFVFCRDKVVHLIMDSVDASFITQASAQQMFSVEDLQEKRRWQKILEWNDQTNFFGSDDIIGFGDCDEIASRYNIHLLKHCHWRNTKPVDIGIWFPQGRIHQAFQTDFSIRGYPFSLGDPTFHNFGYARKETLGGKIKYPTRNRGKSPNFLLGGMHMSHYGYLIYQLLKQMSCSECTAPERYLRVLAQTVQTKQWADLELAWSQPLGGWNQKIIPLEKMNAMERKQLVYLPWFYDCNRQRYSMWEGHTDSRTSNSEHQNISLENSTKQEATKRPVHRIL